MSYRKRVERIGALWALGVITGLSACGESPDVAVDVAQNDDTHGSSETLTTQTQATETHAAQSPAGAANGSTDTADALAQAVDPLRALYPDVSVKLDAQRIQRLYGVSATGETPRAAAESLRNNSAKALGIAPHDLVVRELDAGATNARASDSDAAAEGLGLMYDRVTGKPKFRLFTYDQQRDGVPVHGAGLRALVREGNGNPVVWANVDVRAMGQFRAQADRELPAVDVEAALDALRTSSALTRVHAPVPSALRVADAPTLTVFAGTGKATAAPRLALRYTAADVGGVGKWTFIADIETQQILHVESRLHFDVAGSVNAQVVTGAQSMDCGTLGTAPLSAAQVSTSASSALTNAAGAFNLVQAGSAPVTVVSSITGEFFDVINDAGTGAQLSLQVTPPGPANFLHQDTASPKEFVLAQLNAYKHTSDVRDLLLTHVPGYPVIAGQTDFPIHVNRSELTCDLTGGAWYDDDSAVRSLNFCQRTAERANTAFGSIVHHEYGHHIVESGGSAQNEYGEGMADVVAMLVAKDPRVGLGYHVGQCNEPLRTAENDCQYSATECSSCGQGLYECGAVITGTVWDIWQALSSSEPADADELIRSLVFSSIPLHSGDSIDASIAIDLLTLDDDDALIENGTPHYDEICAGFEQHGMLCPPIVDGLVVKGTDLDAEGPSDGPYAPGAVSYTLHNLGPQQNLAYQVVLPANTPWLSVDSATGSIALGQQVTISVSVNAAQAALLADGDYSALIQLVNATSGVGTVNRVAKLRVGAPVPIYTASFDTGLQGFTPDAEPGNLWHVSTSCLDGLTGHTAPGSLYYGKDSVCDFTTPVPNPHTITSPTIAIANPSMAELGFNYYLATENDPNYDNASVRVSVNGGPFSVVASNNEGGTKLNETNSWKPIRLELAQLLPPTGSSSIQIQLRFAAGDPKTNTNKGFAVDDLIVYAKEQTTPTGPFLEASGQVVIEAEHFSSNTARSSHSWALVSSSQASGQALMSATPNTGLYINNGYASTSPELRFPVRFVTTGTYYVWLRGSGPSANDDSVHVGIDGAELTSADRISTFNSALTWSRSTMDGPVATLQVGNTGVHEINVWMREDGFALDKLVLTRSQNFAPTGNGPNESAREGGTQRPCSAFCNNPITFNAANYQSGNLGTAATCHETLTTINGAVCGNFANGRRLLVNGVQVTCNWSPWSAVPAKVNGGYCLQSTAGEYAWAAFTTW